MGDGSDLCAVCSQSSESLLNDSSWPLHPVEDLLYCRLIIIFMYKMNINYATSLLSNSSSASKCAASSSSRTSVGDTGKWSSRSAACSDSNRLLPNVVLFPVNDAKVLLMVPCLLLQCDE